MSFFGAWFTYWMLPTLLIYYFKPEYLKWFGGYAALYTGYMYVLASFNWETTNYIAAVGFLGAIAIVGTYDLVIRAFMGKPKPFSNCSFTHGEVIDKGSYVANHTVVTTTHGIHGGVSVDTSSYSIQHTNMAILTTDHKIVSRNGINDSGFAGRGDEIVCAGTSRDEEFGFFNITRNQVYVNPTPGFFSILCGLFLFSIPWLAEFILAVLFFSLVFLKATNGIFGSGVTARDKYHLLYAFSYHFLTGFYVMTFSHGMAALGTYMIVVVSMSLLHLIAWRMDYKYFAAYLEKKARKMSASYRASRVVA
ncbi:hypothetical protein ACI2KR_08140 [Pseudomonas luteola]